MYLKGDIRMYMNMPKPYLTLILYANLHEHKK